MWGVLCAPVLTIIGMFVVLLTQQGPSIKSWPLMSLVGVTSVQVLLKPSRRLLLLLQYLAIQQMMVLLYWIRIPVATSLGRAVSDARPQWACDFVLHPSVDTPWATILCHKERAPYCCGSCEIFPSLPSRQTLFGSDWPWFLEVAHALQEPVGSDVAMDQSSQYLWFWDPSPTSKAARQCGWLIPEAMSGV